MNYNFAHQVQIFKSVFKGRDDVFAIRWEKGNKSCYMPAFSYDPYMYRVHKMKGGTFQNYQDIAYLKLNDREIEKHIRGQQLIGVYPMLSDNTSWFLAADFDKDDWFNKARIFMKACIEKGITISLMNFLKDKLNFANSESSRKAKWKIIEDGSCQVLITTGQFFGEGTDLKNANCLFLVYPFSFKGKLI